GDAAFGTTAARSHSWGTLSGIGYGNATGSIGAFVGYVDSGQRIRGLGASTDADGLVAGIVGNGTVAGFDIGGLLAHDWRRANTTRAVPGGATAMSGRYDLHDLVLDVTAGYTVPVTENWSLRAGAGITHIRTRRGAVNETGGAFALDVDRDQASSTFLDGSL